MTHPEHSSKQIQYVSSFEELMSTTYQDEINAICWSRELVGDFAEIVSKVNTSDNITEIEPEDLLELSLSEAGQLAREILLNDLELLKRQGAAPVLNIIVCYERDDIHSIFPTDVYSYHVDRSPIPTNTILCTYYGASSEIISNTDAVQKILIPELRSELMKLYDGPADEFDSFLAEHFFDLHYQAKPAAEPVSLGVGNLWKLAVDHPESQVKPCVHRAPRENTGEKRLLLIC